MSLVCNERGVSNKPCLLPFFIAVASTLDAMATLNFHRLTMGKVKIGIYCYFTADILTKVF